ncbi:hypothetical protein EXM22_11670 [Oceanispirochaeta crateris]|uniref:Uncharacterized protein n=1 Tax=Oceanispirochaeta crateris TaxID=2518645 RepID=A0A5C1QN05_9SPIO|nr:hypothetical protein [Oceanispirochaeta crateris]QEN08609.1 hypothetical protein EXM22_11670 [Oceanispirochaeta crateris]
MKKTIFPVLLILALFLFAGCSSDSGSGDISFSDLAISTLEYSTYGNSYLNYYEYTDVGYAEISFYSEGFSTLPDGDDYECTVSAIEDGQVEFVFTYYDGTAGEVYSFIATSGVVSVVGTTVSFEDVSFYFTKVNYETEEILDFKTVTDSGSFTITPIPES